MLFFGCDFYEVLLEVGGVVPSAFVVAPYPHIHRIQLVVERPWWAKDPADVMRAIHPPAVPFGFLLERGLKTAGEFLRFLALVLTLEDPQLLEKPPHLQAVAGVDDQGWLERDSLGYAHGVVASGREVVRLVRFSLYVKVGPQAGKGAHPCGRATLTLTEGISM